MKGYLPSGQQGYLALALVNLTAPYTGVALPVCRLSLGASGLLGVPGVALLVVLGAIL